MPKRRRSDYGSARKRLKPTANHFYSELSPRTADMLPRLVNQSIYQDLKDSEEKDQNLQDKRRALMQSKMLPTSDGRDMKYEDFTPAYHEETRLASLREANFKIEEFERREKCWEEERKLWLKQENERIKMIEELKEELKVAKEGGFKVPKTVEEEEESVETSEEE